MWQIYLKTVKWLARKAAPTGARYILDPHGFRRAALTSLAAFIIAFTPLIVPAQMSPQERRQFERHEQRLQALEQDNAVIRNDLRRLQDLPSGQYQIQREIAKIQTLIEERDKALSWTITALNAGGLLAAGIYWMIRHRKPSH